MTLGYDIFQTTSERSCGYTIGLLIGYKSEVEKQRKGAVSLSVFRTGVGTFFQISCTAFVTLPSISIAICAIGTNEAMHDIAPTPPIQAA